MCRFIYHITIVTAVLICISGLFSMMDCIFISSFFIADKLYDIHKELKKINGDE